MQIAKSAVRGDLKNRVERARTDHTHKMLDQLDHTMANIEQMPIDDKEFPVERKLNALDRQDLVARRVLGLDKPEQHDPLRDGFMLLAAMGRALVNENDQDYIDEPPPQQPQTTNQTPPEGSDQTTQDQSEGGEEDQIIPLPLPTYSNGSNAPLAPIVRAGNGYPDIPQTPDFHPFAPLSPKLGESGLQEAIKPMPLTINFPIPDDNPTSSDTPSQRDSTLLDGATPPSTARDEQSDPNRDMAGHAEGQQTPPDRVRAPASQTDQTTTP
jgi:hypothetical protein